MSVSKPGSNARQVARIVRAQPSSDGAGVKINRSIGSAALPDLDPFLLLDEIRSDDASDYIGGFPPHPHRGFETVTYMLAGKMRHRDSCDNEGVIEAGGVQWMTAGRGILHSEMPEQSEGRLWGFQIWVNLPSHQKMKTPRYQEFPKSEIPEISVGNDGQVRLIAGSFVNLANGQTQPDAECQGVVTEIETQPLMMDLRLGAGDEFETPVVEGHTALVYVYLGELIIGGQAVQRGHLAVLNDGDRVVFSASEAETGALLMACEPIREPIVRYGPFVMNNKQQLAEAFEDYQNGKFGRM